MAENPIHDVGQEADKPKRGRKRKTNPEPAHSTTTPEIESAIMDTQHVETTTAEQPQIAEQRQVEEASVAPVSSQWYSSCGGVLKAARESQGLSILEVSKQLRLGVNQIQAIEQDDFTKLPQKSIVRGFIRNYARLLKIDATPVLLAYQQLVPDSTPAALSVKSNASQSVIESKSKPLRPTRLLSPMVWLLLISLATYFYVVHIKPHANNTATQSLDASSETVAGAETTDTAEQTVQPTAEIPAAAENVAATQSDNAEAQTGAASAGETQTTLDQPKTMPDQPILSGSTTISNSATTNTTVSSPTPASESVATTTIKALDPNKATLSFKVTDDSWVRIEDGQGKKVFSQILEAGSEQNLTLDKPLNITVGNAGGTKLSIDNQPYDLTQATRGRVARVQLK